VSRHTFHCFATLALFPRPHATKVDSMGKGGSSSGNCRDVEGEGEHRENIVVGVGGVSTPLVFETRGCENGDCAIEALFVSDAATVPRSARVISLSDGTSSNGVSSDVEESMLEAELSRSLGAAQLEDDSGGLVETAHSSPDPNIDQPSQAKLIVNHAHTQAQQHKRPQQAVHAYDERRAVAGSKPAGVAVTLSAMGVGPTKKDAKHAASKLLLTQLFMPDSKGSAEEALRLANSAKHAFAQSKRSKRHALWEPQSSSSPRSTTPSPALPSSPLSSSLASNPIISGESLDRTPKFATGQQTGSASEIGVFLDPQAVTSDDVPALISTPEVMATRKGSSEDVTKEPSQLGTSTEISEDVSAPLSDSLNPRASQQSKRRRDGSKGVGDASPDDENEEHTKDDCRVGSTTERYPRSRTASSPPSNKRDASQSSSTSRERVSDEGHTARKGEDGAAMHDEVKAAGGGLAKRCGGSNEVVSDGNSGSELDLHANREAKKNRAADGKPER